MHYLALIDDRAFRVLLPDEGSVGHTASDAANPASSRADRDHAVDVDGAGVHVDLPAPNGNPVRSILVGGRSFRLISRRGDDGRWTIDIDGHRVVAEVLDHGEEAVRSARKAVAGAGGPTPLRAPMPGLVLRVDVAPGDEVAANQGVVIVEAMKMENELRAPVPGRVTAVHVTPGEAVEKDRILVEFEPLDDDEPVAASEGEGE